MYRQKNSAGWVFIFYFLISVVLYINICIYIERACSSVSSDQRFFTWVFPLLHLWRLSQKRLLPWPHSVLSQTVVHNLRHPHPTTDRVTSYLFRGTLRKPASAILNASKNNDRKFNDKMTTTTNGEDSEGVRVGSVSYTHLTLPTMAVV